MRFAPRPSLRVLSALVVLAVLGACGVFGPSQHDVWICLNPDSGKLDGAPYDANHYVNGVLDPCHCYDPCGPEKSCPTVVDAGPLPAGCDAGAGVDGGDGAP